MPGRDCGDWGRRSNHDRRRGRGQRDRPRERTRVPEPSSPERHQNHDSESGDLVVWNLRTSHSGNNVRLKFWPSLSLPPRIESRIPLFLRVPPQDEIFEPFGEAAAQWFVKEGRFDGAEVERTLQSLVSLSEWMMLFV